MRNKETLIQRSDNLSELVYQRIKNDIFDFKLMPSERFTESEIAEVYKVSRTPVRQALYRLQQEGYVDVGFRRGWQVKPLNFRYYEELYDVRIILESTAVDLLCSSIREPSVELQILSEKWCVEPKEYIKDFKILSQQDEDFHCTLVRTAGNQEMARIHRELSEKIRIIRRLDFSKEYRVEATYLEHQKIIELIIEKNKEEALDKLISHIKQSRDAVKKITLQMLDNHQIL
ncbi:GntR family transcriptional regulator [Acinetobacter nectaris]|uniref:GntR family transcriptional regulator n=1 Tax=Acinetobacter nectaris TaxID=1219382 RepID=UPI001F2DF4C7|nr:GntR family transcriptional regulator [Acinetobacter nectaris]MCF8998221.1 GntR family transcriptional regulator [Acinetobacter nectaris]MCF9026853.1 GntR family transcriptional regulator [Acinetobacter nectaris]